MACTVAGESAVVVPTRVGVNRDPYVREEVCQRCPHARGGEPVTVINLLSLWRLSPRAWG